MIMIMIGKIFADLRKSISTNSERTEKSFVSASIADSSDFDSVSAVNEKRVNTFIRDIQNSIIYGDK